MKTRFSAIIAICCLAVVTPAFGKKKKGKGGDNSPETSEVTPPKPDGSNDAKPAADTGTTTPEAKPITDRGATTPTPPPAPLTGNITTLSGKIYEAVALKSVDSDGLLIVHKKGTTKVLLTDLPENLRTAYGYEQKFVAFQAAKAAKAEKQAEADAAAAAKKELAKKTVRIKGTIIQILRDGMLVEREQESYAAPVASSSGSIGGGGGVYAPSKKNSKSGPSRPPLLSAGAEFIFVVGHKQQESKVDKDKIDVDAYADGVFSYTATNSASRRVRRYQVVKTVR